MIAEGGSRGDGGRGVSSARGEAKTGVAGQEIGRTSASGIVGERSCSTSPSDEEDIDEDEESGVSGRQT